MAAICYFALTLAYSFALKHEVMVDVLTLSIGFVLRVVAGCLAIPVLISPWIVFCTFSLALFISLCKPRAELNEIRDIGTRGVLTHYSQEMLDMLIAVSAGTDDYRLFVLHVFGFARRCSGKFSGRVLRP